MTPTITLSKAMSDPALFGRVFASPSFWTWRCVAKVIDGLPLSKREMAFFQQCTGRTKLPSRASRRQLRRIFLLCGRRAGKDRFESACGIWRAALCADWRQHISPGEMATVLLLGRDKRQARILRNYCEGLLEAPLLAAEVVRRTDDGIEFRNGSCLEIGTNDARLIRGRSAIAVLGSECCHWKVDELSASSDAEVIAAAEPSMAMTADGGLLLLGSSVHRRRGFMYDQFTKLHGRDDTDDIVWFADSKTMNPVLPQSFIDGAMARDAARARAEFFNQWREDVSDFCPLDVVENCTDHGIAERPPQHGITYFSFCDAAGGTGQDSYVFCIGHREGGKIVIDVLRERKPRFIPRAVVAEFAAICRQYRVTEVEGDAFASGFHIDDWQVNGIRYVPSPATTSENYQLALGWLLSGHARLLDIEALRKQIAALERIQLPAGGERITHPKQSSAHDDLAAGALGLVAKLARQPLPIVPSREFLARVAAMPAVGGAKYGRRSQPVWPRWMQPKRSVSGAF